MDNGLDLAQRHFDKQEPPEDTPKLICSECGCNIYEGNFYLEINNKPYCQLCVSDEFGRFA